MPIGPDEMDVMIFTGGDTPDSGWLSTGYKHRVEAPFIKYGKRARVPMCFHTLLCAYNAEKALSISGRHLRVFSQETPLLSDEVSAIELSMEYETHYFVLLYKNHQQIQFENITFSGTLLFMRKQEEEIVELILHDATLLTMGDCVIFQSDAPVEGLVLEISDDSLNVLCSGSHTFRTQLPQIKHVFVNERKAFLKQEDNMLVVSTSRI
jgi:hypothetical protein